MKTKIQKEYLDTGFGFPVRLYNVEMVRVRGTWTPKLNYNVLARAVVLALCRKSARLSGSEVRFIRTHFEMTLQEFASRFCVTHVAIMKWEKTKDRPILTSWTTEKDIRLFALSKLDASPLRLARLYKDLEMQPAGKAGPIGLDAQGIAA